MKLVVINFIASWFNLYKRAISNIQKLQKEFPNIEFQQIDIDNDDNLVNKYKIESVPTLLLLMDDVEVKRVEGVVLISSLRKVLREFEKSCDI